MSGPNFSQAVENAKISISRRAVLLGLSGSMLPAIHADAKVAVNGGPGKSRETAFVITADNEMDGVMAEYVVLKRMYPDWKRGMQTLRSFETRHYDVHNLSKNGKTIEVWFDITSFFGKY